jgi:RND superfamily putative drug exporter
MNLGNQLHKLGAFTYKHPWRIVSGWVVILALLGFAASQLYQAPSSAITIPGTKAQESIDAISRLFPDAGGATGRIVFHTQDGNINTHKDEIESLVQKVSTVDGVSRAISPFADPSFISEDKTIAYSQVQLKEQTGSVAESTLEKVQSLTGTTRSNSLQIEVGGDLVSATPGEIIGVGEALGVAVALMVLIITLGSLIAGGMPILSAVLSVGVSMAGLFALSKVVTINSTTPVLAVMLGLAVGIDYALFIVNKYRTLLLQGMAGKDAVARAMGTAGNAVVFAAITVIIALAALSVVNIPFMTTMGLSGAASIAVAATVTLTLIPALLGIAGDRIFSRKQRAKKSKAASKKQEVNTQTIWYKWGGAIAHHPIPVLVLSIIVVAVIALPAKDMTLSLPTDQYAAKDLTERKAYDLLSDGFGVGFNAPLTVVVQNLPKVSDADKETVRAPAIAALNKQIADEAAKQRVAFQQQMQMASPEQQFSLQQAAVKAQIEGEKQKVAAYQTVEKNVTQYAKYVQLNRVATAIGKIDNVQKVQPALVTADDTSGIVQVIPKTAPADQATKDLIATLRNDNVAQKAVNNTSLTVGVTGTAALQDDINTKLANALPVYLAVIVGLSLLLLLVAFRSILVPIKATLGYILSVLAMFGAIVVVFQWGWFGITDAVGPVISFMPIIAAGILFGLAMDYEFFLVSGMHESYSHTHDAKRAVVEGFGNGAKVVTAAAIIMISVFGAFITNHETVIQSIGFGLAVGILVDAFIVRMLLVPAVMTLLGKHAWWLPAWLDKRLPHISIEGESETKQ